MRGKALFVLTVLTALTGCAGEYRLTVPDTVAAPGGEAPVIARLERSEFWRFHVPIGQAALRFEASPGRQRAAYTDAAGYAALAVPVADEPGEYPLHVRLQDARGDEAYAEGRIFVLQPNRLTLAVSWAALQADPAEAADALARLAEAGVGVIYLAGEPARQPESSRAWLAERNLPPGPVLPWVVPAPGDPLTGGLPAARRVLAGLEIVVLAELPAADAVAALEMVPVTLGQADGTAVALLDWASLAQRLLTAPLLMGEHDFELIAPEDVRDALTR